MFLRVYARPARLQASSVAFYCFALVFSVGAQPRQAVTLTSIQQIRSLTPEQAARKLPVHVRGTVTTLSGYKDSFFLQDKTAGIAVNRLEQGPSLQAGDVIDVEGVSEPGFFAPSLNSKLVHVIGRGEFPKARTFHLNELTGGAQDSQWLALRGVVRAGEVKPIWNHQTLSLTVDIGEGLVNVRVLDYAGEYRRLVDAEVLLQGVCGTIYNGHRQFAGVRVFVPSLREILIEKPSQGDPFRSPLRPLDGLLQFGRNIAPYHRIRVGGTVIYQSPEREMYLQQGSLTLLIHTETADRVPVGAVVEAVGFVAQGAYSPELQNAIFQVIGKAPLSEPVSTKASQIIATRNSALYIPYDGQLVRMRGQVVGLGETSREQTMLLNDAGTVFPVKLYKASSGNAFQISPGSLVQVTGICSAVTNQNGDPESFQILARSPADLLILMRPSWWNTRHTLGVLAITVVCTLIALGFICRQRKRIERQRQALISSARVFQRVLDEVPLLALSLDRNGRVTACNDLLLKLLGRSPEEVIGRNWQEHFVAEACPSLDMPLADANFSETLRTRHEDYISNKDGSRRLVSWFNAVIHDASGNGTAAIALGEDISERKRAEEELGHAVETAQAASQAKSEFLANMSHEIRTPMNGILGMTELVLQSELNAEQRESLNMVKSSADALLTIINDILDFSKVEAGKLTLEFIPFCLEDVLSEAVAPLAMQAANKGLRMFWSADEQAPRYLLGDPGRLRQVLLNLLGNALKFTKAGEITLQVKTECLAESGVELHFLVRDTGIGIPAKQQGEIFKAFSQANTSITRQFGGTGLGLTICARLVNLFGGKIWVESEPGVGSTFHFTAKLGIGTAPAAISPAVDTSNMLLLLVDDNGTSRETFHQALINLGSQATVVESGEAALRAFEQAASSGCPYPLVILDMEMPGSNGFSVAQRIRQMAGPDRTKLILLASHGLRGDAALCAQLGIGGYLQKPVTCSDLQRAISEVMGSTASGSSVPRLVTRHSLREARRHVLLAEDNVVNQRLAAKLLEKQGHTVVIAQNGQEAVEAIEREDFDVVLMDVQMPVMGGFEATAQIRSKEKDRGGRVKILALTANAMSGDREKCLEAGMDGYLTKPLKFDELYAALT